MTSQRPDPYSSQRMLATLTSLRTLTLVAAIVSLVLVVFVVTIELILPVDPFNAVRDGVSLGMVSAASWSIFALTSRMARTYPRSGGTFGWLIAIMIVLGGGSLIVNFVLDLIALFVIDVSARVVPIAAPVALVICVVVPGVYAAFAARRMRVPAAIR